jgi:glycosyltransferase involved in cell wall biosynthesis
MSDESPPVPQQNVSQPDPPSISVVIPTYNRARFITDALDGVYAQRDCPTFEVVVVDDGSADDTATVVRAHPHAPRLVHLERNVGVAAARDAGVRHARGALVAFHDSDDIMLPGRLGHLAAYLDAHPDVGAVFANGEVETADGSPGGPIVPREVARRLHERRVDARDILREGVPFFPQATLVRRAVLDAAGGIDTTLDWHADWEIACRLALVAPVVFLDRCVFRYRLHGGNVSGDRLRLREGFVTAIRRLRAHRPEVVAAVGATWLRRREARHLYQIARAHLGSGDRERARAAIGEALALEPASLRYRWLRWRAARG